MSDENTDESTPPPPPGLPPLPPTPPAPPGMDEPPAPPAPPGLDAPPEPPAPPGMDEPPEPPAPPDLDAPPEPPAPPAPPGLDEPPEPPAPPSLEPEEDEAELSDPMDLLGDMEDEISEPPAPPEPPETPPPAPPGMDLLAPPAPPEPPSELEEETEDSDLSTSALDLLAPPAPPEESAEEDEEAEEPPAPPALDLLGPGPEPEEEEEPEPEEEPIVLASPPEGGRIRSTSAVDAIPGDKLIGTLTEVEAVTLSPDGSMVKQTVDGVLTMSNPSDKDRLWDIDVTLYGRDHTDVATEMPFAELESSADQSLEYAVEGPRMLCVRERIDTNPSRGQEHSLSVVRDSDAQKIHLELEVENLGPVQLNDVVVTRVFPIQIQVGEGEGYDKQGDTVTWTVGRLASGESRSLSVPTSVTAEAIDAIDAGHATATYSAEATLSGMGFEEIDAHCRGFSYMVVDEDERPDNYRCQAVFENRSSFTVDLARLTVRQTGADDPLFSISDVADDVLPDGRWESDVEIVHSTEKPTFSQELTYSVIPRVTLGTEGLITLQAHTIEVLEAEVEKTYSLDVLRHYRETEMTATMEIENTGSATINLLRITDDVPGIFNAPDADSVKASIDGHELIRDQFRIELKDGISIEENRVSPDGPGHTMLITVGTKGPIGLAPGHRMCITYPLVAPDPSPSNDVIAAPARIDFSSERFGPVATRGLNVVPAVRVTHRKVSYDSGKEVFPAGGAGRYEAMIMFNNRADSALQDVVIHDIIPGAFELLEWSVKSSEGGKVKCKMAEEATTDGKKMSWSIGTVARGERIEVTYEFKGDPEAGFKVRDAQEVHGIDVGAEVEDDLPPNAEPEPEPEPEPETEAVEEEAVDEEAAEEEESVEDESDADEESVDEEDAEEEESAEDESDADEEEVAEEAEPAEEEAADPDPGPVSEEDAAMNEALAKITGSGGEAPAEEAASDADSESRACPICQAENAAGLAECSVCSFTF